MEDSIIEKDILAIISHIKSDATSQLISIIVSGLELQYRHAGDDKKAFVLNCVLKGETLSDVRIHYAEKYNVVPESARHAVRQALGHTRGTISRLFEINKEYEQVRRENVLLRYRIYLYKKLLEKLAEKEAAEIVNAEPSELMYQSPYNAGLSTRLTHRMKWENIETYYDIVNLGKNEFLKMRNCGKKTLQELDDHLHSLGIEWS
jgi:predicted RNase H-like nuclease (RuvC/YqgF family)